MDAQHVLPWETWATKSHGDPWIKAPWQLLHLISPVYAIHSSADRTRQGCPCSAQGGGGWRPWARRAPTAQEKQGCWARLGVNYCSCPAINTSRALEIRREMFQQLRGQAVSATVQKATPSLERGTAWKGREGGGNSFLKPLSLCSLLIPLNFLCPKESIILVLILMIFCLFNFKRLPVFSVNPL